MLQLLVSAHNNGADREMYELANNRLLLLHCCHLAYNHRRQCENGANRVKNKNRAHKSTLNISSKSGGNFSFYTRGTPPPQRLPAAQCPAAAPYRSH